MFIEQTSKDNRKGGKNMVTQEKQEKEQLVSNLSKLSANSLLIIQTTASALLARDEMIKKEGETICQK